MTHTAKTISFRPLAASDLVMLHEWLHRPHVAEWWDDFGTSAEVEYHYRPTTNKLITGGCIANRSNYPAGNKLLVLKYFKQKEVSV